MFARYYNSTTGRFLSPDWSAKEEPVPYAKLTDPQSLNLYSYVENNPMDRTDPDGHQCDLCEKVGNKLAGNGWKTDKAVRSGLAKTMEPSPAAPGGPPRDIVVNSMQSFHPVPGGETVAQIAGRVNNETNRMKDKPGENMPLFNAKVDIAAQRMNAEQRYGSKVDARSGMMSPSMSGPGYAEALSATVTAVENRYAGQDTTNGAYQYNMRNDSQAARGGPFEGAAVHTNSGPYSSPSQYDWIFTYGK
jgi:RHS repeat-associated protein